MEQKQKRYFLPEDEIPRYWYNIQIQHLIIIEKINPLTTSQKILILHKASKNPHKQL